MTGKEVRTIARAYEEVWITAFMTSCKRTEIMKTAGISKSQYYRLKGDQEFQKIINERRSELIREAVLKMESYLSKDVEILQGIIEDPETPRQIKINGIQLMMNQLAQWKQTDHILDMIQALEDAEGLNKPLPGVRQG